MNEQSVMLSASHTKSSSEARPLDQQQAREKLPVYRRVLDGFYFGCFIVAMIAMTIMGMGVLIQIGGRLLGVHVPSIPEIVGFSMAASSFLALAYTFREGGHVRVAILLTRLGPRRRLQSEQFVLTIAFLISVVFAFFLVQMVVESYRFNEASSGVIAISLWIPQSFVAAGVVVLSIAVADLLVDSLRGHLPAYVDEEDLPQ